MLDFEYSNMRYRLFLCTSIVLVTISVLRIETSPEKAADSRISPEYSREEASISDSVLVERRC